MRGRPDPPHRSGWSDGAWRIRGQRCGPAPVPTVRQTVGHTAAREARWPDRRCDGTRAGERDAERAIRRARRGAFGTALRRRAAIRRGSGRTTGRGPAHPPWKAKRRPGSAYGSSSVPSSPPRRSDVPTGGRTGRTPSGSSVRGLPGGASLRWCCTAISRIPASRSGRIAASARRACDPAMRPRGPEGPPVGGAAGETRFGGTAGRASRDSDRSGAVMHVTMMS